MKKTFFILFIALFTTSCTQNPRCNHHQPVLQNTHERPLSYSDESLLDSDLFMPQITAGGYHTCAIDSERMVKCWGGNSVGQLGSIRALTVSTSPVELDEPQAMLQISAGLEHTCSITEENNIKCWGSNRSGQLGNGTRINSSNPLPVLHLSDATQVSAGSHHTCAITQDHSVKCWGSNRHGQLGNGTIQDSSIPVQLAGLDDVLQITSGVNHTCICTMGGIAKCWGDNRHGQLGYGRLTNSLLPVDVQEIRDVVQVSAGESHTCALTRGGEVRCWGIMDFTQFEGPTARFIANPPTLVTGLHHVVQISAGSSHTCALLQDGQARCWGSNSMGQLGNRSTTSSTTPVNVTDLPDAVSISVGLFHSCAMNHDGLVKCWGANHGAQLGNGTTTPIDTLIEVLHLRLNELSIP